MELLICDWVIKSVDSFIGVVIDFCVYKFFGYFIELCGKGVFVFDIWSDWEDWGCEM